MLRSNSKGNLGLLLAAKTQEMDEGEEDNSDNALSRRMLEQGERSQPTRDSSGPGTTMRHHQDDDLKSHSARGENRDEEDLRARISRGHAHIDPATMGTMEDGERRSTNPHAGPSSSMKGKAREKPQESTRSQAKRPMIPQLKRNLAESQAKVNMQMWDKEGIPKDKKDMRRHYRSESSGSEEDLDDEAFAIKKDSLIKYGLDTKGNLARAYKNQTPTYKSESRPYNRRRASMYPFANNRDNPDDFEKWPPKERSKSKAEERADWKKRKQDDQEFKDMIIIEASTSRGLTPAQRVTITRDNAKRFTMSI
jgi:hypothetical protein